MKPWFRITFAVLALAIARLATAGVSASLDAYQVAPGDTVAFTLEHDGQTHDEPDLAPLERDFDVLGRNSSTSIQVINGRASASTRLTLTLSPKRSGTLTVPSITWSGERTQPLTLNVASGAGGQDSDSGDARAANVFLETEVDPKQPFVQSAVRVTVKLYVAEALYRANLDFPGSGDVIVQKLGDDEQSEAARNGRSYQVVTRHYMLFPQHSGAIKLPGPVLNAQIADRRRSSGNDPFASVFGQSLFSSMTATRPVRLRGDEITLDVQPRPAGFQSGYWLPAEQVTLEGEWNPANVQAHVGDPITLTLHLQAVGQTAAQLPDLSSLLELPNDVKAYPDQARLDNSTRGGAIVGSRSQSIALIADEAGRFSVPDLKVRWWDTRTGQPRETTLPGKTLVILPPTGAPSMGANTASNAGASVAQGASQESSATSSSGGASTPAANAAATSTSGDAGMWRWIALSLGALWIATVAAWLVSRWIRAKARPSSASSASSAAESGSAASSGSAAQARAAFQAACRQNDARGARRALLAWARVKAPDNPPGGLNALAKRIDDPALANRIRELDRACYAGESWQGGDALARELKDLSVRKSTGSADQSRSELAPLYH